MEIVLVPLFTTEFKKMPELMEVAVFAAIVVEGALPGNKTPLLELLQVSAFPPVTLVETAIERQ